jgi:hypothetical protein
MNRNPIPLLVVCLGALGFLAPGCASTGMARTLDAGRLQVSLVPGAQAATGYEDSGVAFPQAEVGVRYGLTDRIDVGARLFVPGLGVDARFALLRAPSLRSGVELTLAPSVLYTPDLSNGLQSVGKGIGLVQLPLLVGVNLGGSQLVLGPRVGFLFDGTGSTTARQLPLAGTSLGCAFPIGNWFRLTPEVSVLQPFGYPFGGQMMVHGGIGFLFGGYAEE